MAVTTLSDEWRGPVGSPVEGQEPQGAEPLQGAQNPEVTLVKGQEPIRLVAQGEHHQGGVRQPDVLIPVTLHDGRGQLGVPGADTRSSSP